MYGITRRPPNMQMQAPTCPAKLLLSTQGSLYVTVIRKERIHEVSEGGTKKRIGTKHHSVMCLTRRGSTQTVVYASEPVFIPVDKRAFTSAITHDRVCAADAIASPRAAYGWGGRISSHLRTTEGGGFLGGAGPCGAQSGPVHSFRPTRCHLRSAVGMLSVRQNNP